ncbi:MAG: phage tail protein [Firmicutes bacterium]|nr:phage tail protein [Bacillota bacterium]
MKFNAFDLQRFAVTLPTNPSTSSATVGKDYLLNVNTGTPTVPIWTIVGGQRGTSLARSADEIDVSHKTSGGWKSVKAGLRSWSMDLDGLVLLQDEGLQALEYAFMQGIEVNIQLLYPDGSYQTGWGSLTDFSMETPHDGEASLSGTISGNGALSDRTPGISPLTATMSLAAAADKVFTILPATTTVSSVKNGSTAITVTTDYTYSSGTLTILSGYLDGLTAGAYTFTVTTGDGAALTVTITITA